MTSSTKYISSATIKSTNDIYDSQINAKNSNITSFCPSRNSHEQSQSLSAIQPLEPKSVSQRFWPVFQSNFSHCAFRDHNRPLLGSCSARQSKPHFSCESIFTLSGLKPLWQQHGCCREGRISKKQGLKIFFPALVLQELCAYVHYGSWGRNKSCCKG